MNEKEKLLKSIERLRKAQEAMSKAAKEVKEKRRPLQEGAFGEGGVRTANSRVRP